MKKKNVISLCLASVMALSLTACGGGKDESKKADVSDLPTIDQIKLGEDYKDLKADIKILTNRTDIVDTVYNGYAEEFEKLYPNISVTYEAITDYE